MISPIAQRDQRTFQCQFVHIYKYNDHLAQIRTPLHFSTVKGLHVVFVHGETQNDANVARYVQISQVCDNQLYKQRNEEGWEVRSWPAFRPDRSTLNVDSALVETEVLGIVKSQIPNRFYV